MLLPRDMQFLTTGSVATCSAHVGAGICFEFLMSLDDQHVLIWSLSNGALISVNYMYNSTCYPVPTSVLPKANRFQRGIELLYLLPLALIYIYNYCNKCMWVCKATASATPPNLPHVNIIVCVCMCENIFIFFIWTEYGIRNIVTFVFPNPYKIPFIKLMSR